MPIDVHPARRGRSPEEIVKEQKAQAEKNTARANARKITSGAASSPDVPSSANLVPAKPDAAAVATLAADTRTPAERYLDEIAPAAITGRLIKFGKEGTFITADDGEPVPEGAEFLALCDETLIGWIRFHDDDMPPDRVQGLWADGFVMPQRESLGDTDPTQWDAGLSGAPEDPWHHQVCLVLQNVETKEFYTFATTSATGRRAAGNLLKHYKRMQRTNAGEVPVVRLKSGGFNHRDDRIGWVPVPVFAVVGRAPRDSAARPDTSAATDMNDSLPF
jgi:hypothetical protein